MSTTVHLSAKQVAMIDELAAIGNYGSTHSEVVEYLVRRSLDDLLRAGVLTVPLIMVEKKRRR